MSIDSTSYAYLLSTDILQGSRAQSTRAAKQTAHFQLQRSSPRSGREDDLARLYLPARLKWDPRLRLQVATTHSAKTRSRSGRLKTQLRLLRSSRTTLKSHFSCPRSTPLTSHGTIYFSSSLQTRHLATNTTRRSVLLGLLREQRQCDKTPRNPTLTGLTLATYPRLPQSLRLRYLLLPHPQAKVPTRRQLVLGHAL